MLKCVSFVAIASLKTVLEVGTGFVFMRAGSRRWFLAGIELGQYLPWKVLNTVTGPVGSVITACNNSSA